MLVSGEQSGALTGEAYMVFSILVLFSSEEARVMIDEIALRSWGYAIKWPTPL